LPNLGSFFASFPVVESLGSFKYKSYHLQIGIIWLFTSLLEFLLFLSMARYSSNILHKCGKNGHSCLVPDFKRSDFSFSSLSMMLAIGLSSTAFFMLKCIPSILRFYRAAIMKGCWILSKALSASIEMIMWFLSLILFMCYIIFIN
jgi:hypothetical protein